MDYALAQFCNALGRGWIDGATGLVCEISVMVAFTVVLLGLSGWRDRSRAKALVLALVIAMVLHFAFDEGLLKHTLVLFIGVRERPWIAHAGDILPVGQRFHDSSFPSSHTATTSAIATVFGTFYRWSIVPGVAAVVLIAFARVHNGMHYPTDVLTGAILGTTFGFAAFLIARRWLPKPTTSDVGS